MRITQEKMDAIAVLMDDETREKGSLRIGAMRADRVFKTLL